MNSIIFPGAYIEEGASVGAMSLIVRSTKSWGVFFGIPAKRAELKKLEQENYFG